MSTSGEDAASYQLPPEDQGQAFPGSPDQAQSLPVPAAVPSEPTAQAYAGAYPQVQAHNPMISVLASLFIPGLGSMLNEKVGKGVGILAAYVVSCILMLVIVGFIAAPAVWIWGMVAANSDANEWNRAHGIIS